MGKSRGRGSSGRAVPLGRRGSSQLRASSTFWGRGFDTTQGELALSEHYGYHYSIWPTDPIIVAQDYLGYLKSVGRFLLMGYLWLVLTCRLAAASCDASLSYPSTSSYVSLASCPSSSDIVSSSIMLSDWSCVSSSPDRGCSDCTFGGSRYNTRV